MNLQFLHRFQREDGGANSGGDKPVLPPSLQDVFTPGDGTPKAPVLDPNTPPADGTGPKQPPAPEKVEGVKEDGTLEEGYIKQDDGKVIKDPNYKPATDPAKAEGEEENEDDTTAEAFYGTVSKLTGIPEDAFKVEYPEGTDPLSPEGVALREQVIMEYGAQQFEAVLQQQDPRAYAYFIHRANGGTDEEFLGNSRGGYVLPDIANVESSADTQKAVYLQDLLMKGVDKEEADALVEAAIKGNKLIDKAKAAHKNIDSVQKQQLQRQQDTVKAAEEETNKAIAGMSTAIDKAIDGEISYTVPANEKAAFKQFVLDNMQYDPTTKKFFLMQEVPQSGTKVLLESLLLQFKKGSLDTLVKKQAETKAVHRLRMQADRSKQKTPGSQDDIKTNNIPLSLDEVWNTSKQ